MPKPLLFLGRKAAESGRAAPESAAAVPVVTAAIAEQFCLAISFVWRHLRPSSSAVPVLAPAGPAATDPIDRKTLQRLPSPPNIYFTACPGIPDSALGRRVQEQFE